MNVSLSLCLPSIKQKGHSSSSILASMIQTSLDKCPHTHTHTHFGGQTRIFDEYVCMCVVQFVVVLEFFSKILIECLSSKYWAIKSESQICPPKLVDFFVHHSREKSGI